MIYFESDSGALYHDTVLTKNRIQDNSIDLIVTSTPYNLSVKYENYKADIPCDEYLEFAAKRIREFEKNCQTVNLIFSAKGKL